MMSSQKFSRPEAYFSPKDPLSPRPLSLPPRAKAASPVREEPDSPGNSAAVRISVSSL
jgi:hypothetical protein